MIQMKWEWMLLADCLLPIHWIWWPEPFLWLSKYVAYLVFTICIFFFFFFHIYTMSHYSFPFARLHFWILGIFRLLLLLLLTEFSAKLNRLIKKAILDTLNVHCSCSMFNATAYGSCLWQVQCETFKFAIANSFKVLNIVDLFIIYSNWTAECRQSCHADTVDIYFASLMSDFGFLPHFSLHSISIFFDSNFDWLMRLHVTK